MSLEYANFAHHYTDSGLTEDQQREHFSVLSDVLEFIARHFWYGSEANENPLGISWLGAPTASGNAVESEEVMASIFQEAAKGAVGGEGL